MKRSSPRLCASLTAGAHSASGRRQLPLENVFKCADFDLFRSWTNCLWLFRGYACRPNGHLASHLPVSFPGHKCLLFSGGSALSGALAQCNKCHRGQYEVTSVAHSLCGGCGPCRHRRRTTTGTRRTGEPWHPSIATSLPQNGDPFGIRKQLYGRTTALALA